MVLYESRLDIKYATTHIQTSLALLDANKKSVKNNISKFNTYIQGLLRSLSKQRETNHN